MVKVKTFILSVAVLVALVTLSFQGHARDRKKKEAAERQEMNPYDSLVKKSQVSAGMVRLLADGNDYYFEIADSLMGRDLLIVNKVSGVPGPLNDAGLNKGMEYDNKLIRFYRDADAGKVWVTTYDPRISVPEGDAIARSVKDNYREAIIEFFPIEAYNHDSTTVVVKVNKVFDGSAKSFNDVYNSIALSMASFKSDLSKIKSVKVFPKNIVVKAYMTATVTDSGVDVPLTVETTTNIVLLPKEPMTPRFADSRVGFFSSEHVYFNDAQQQVERREFVHRWRLEPKPEDVERYKRGELVEPRKPIVFYVDPSTPSQWREAIKAGVRDWQAAFEAAGFKNAVVAKDAPRDGDFDIEDVRYSVITYAASEQANAMGPSLVDPRSGEIIEADIVWWHNVMSLLHTWMRVQTGPIDERARGNKFTDEHMADAIRFVSSHEVGHTFGLKHNMGASWSFPVDSLRSPSFTSRMGGTASSIMDYARFNYVAQPGDGVTDITPKIGIYDKYAINWAYRWLDAKDPHDEIPVLNRWIQEHDGDPMYWYGEQQDPSDPIDPRAQDEDLGDDIVRANKYGIMNLQRIMPNLVAWTEEENEGYFQTGKLLMAVINQWKMYAAHVTANVGGFYLTNLVKGSPGERCVPVPKEMQKKSVQYLIDEVFIVPEWLFGADAWKKSYPIMNGVEYAPYNVARELQYEIFYNLLKDVRLLRMYEAEAALGKSGAYTPEEMFGDLHRIVFRGTLAGRSLTLYERMTQKNFIDAIIVSSNKAVEKTTKRALRPSERPCDFASRQAAFASGEPADFSLQILHFSSMNRVSESVSVKRGELLKVLKLVESRRSTGDEATRNHYEDLIVRVKEALNIR